MRKIKQENRPIVFVTRDTKSDWFIDSEPNPLLMEEVNKKCGEYKIFKIMSLEQYIEFTNEFVNEEVTELINNLVDRGSLVQYIEDEFLKLKFFNLEEELSERLRNEHDIDYVDLDTLEHIQLKSVNEVEEYEDEIIVNCEVEVLCSYDYIVCFAGDKLEISGEAVIQIDIDFIVGLERGQNRKEKKMISVTTDNININNVDIIKSSDPRGYS